MVSAEPAIGSDQGTNISHQLKLVSGGLPKITDDRKSFKKDPPA